MRCSYKTLQKLKYLGNMNTHVVLFYRLSFCASFFPNKCPSLKKNLSTPWIFVILWQILKRFALISEEWIPSSCQISVQWCRRKYKLHVFGTNIILHIVCVVRLYTLDPQPPPPFDYLKANSRSNLFGQFCL